MFLILYTYQKPLTVVDEYLLVHRAYLDECYAKGYFLTTGPRSPRTGAVLLSPLDELAKLEQILNKDPFIVQQIASYEIIPFEPVKATEHFKAALAHAKELIQSNS